MRTFNATTSALRLVNQTAEQKATTLKKHDTACADIRTSLRNEAQMLTSVGRCLLILCVVVSALMCAVNGFVYSELMNMRDLYLVGLDTHTVTWLFAVICVGGILFAGASVFLSLVMFGVADTLRQEAKKIK